MEDMLSGAAIAAIRDLLNKHNVPAAAYIDDHVHNAIIQRDEAEAKIKTLQDALAKLQERIETLEKDKAKQIDYSIDLQAIIEDLCNNRDSIRKPKTDAFYHYDMAVAALTGQQHEKENFPVLRQVRHVNRGSDYHVVFEDAELQVHGLIAEGTKLVIYVGEDGKVWARPDFEFNDGRFIMPKITAVFETVDNGITGMTNAPVKRVMVRDDGSYTVVIDHWPR